jgi:alkylation response protein AidB-like acyl-CoA dehydrogenase
MLTSAEERKQLREIVVGVARDAATPSALMASLGETGMLGLATAEEFGGGGAGLLELSIVAGALAEGPTTSPFVPSAVVATLMVGEQPSGASHELLRKLAGGGRLATAAWSEVSSLSAADLPTVTSGAITGSLRHVPWAAQAQTLVATACHTCGTEVFAVDLHGGGVTIEPEQAFDATEPLCTVHLNGARASLLPSTAVTSDRLGAARARIRAVISAELTATGRAVLASAIEYARIRTQFGRPIGSFQSVKHMLVDAHLELDAAEALARRACAAHDRGDPEAASLSRLALAGAVAAADIAAANSLQTFGGIGYTWEQGTHRYIRRVRARTAQFGSADLQLANIADEIARSLAADGPVVPGNPTRSGHGA